jgi:hypothetical protein
MNQAKMPKFLKSAVEALEPAAIDAAVMARLKPPFGCEHIPATRPQDHPAGRWRIRDANDDAIASVAGAEEGYARFLVEALNLHPRFVPPAPPHTPTADELRFTSDLHTRTLVLRAIQRNAANLLEQATDMQIRSMHEDMTGGSDDVPSVEMARLEQSFQNAYARLLELVTTFPRKRESE